MRMTVGFSPTFVRILAGLGLVAALTSGTSALAGDELGISDAGGVFATALATLGVVMSIAGLAIAGFLMATNFFLALTVGGSLIVGGSVMALSEEMGGALWGADLGGGNVAHVELPVTPDSDGGTAYRRTID